MKQNVFFVSGIDTDAGNEKYILFHASFFFAMI